MRELLELLYPENKYYVKEPGLLVKAIRKPLSICYKIFTSRPSYTFSAFIRYIKGELNSKNYYGSYKK